MLGRAHEKPAAEPRTIENRSGLNSEATVSTEVHGKIAELLGQIQSKLASRSAK